MSTDVVTTLEQLVRVGALVHDAFTNQSAAKSIDEFMATPAYAQIKASVETIVSSVSDDKIDDAIARLDEQQNKLRNGAPLASLPNDKLIQYLQLGDARLALSTQRVKVAANADFLTWVSQKLLPELLKILTTILPLVL